MIPKAPPPRKSFLERSALFVAYSVLFLLNASMGFGCLAVLCAVGVVCHATYLLNRDWEEQ